MTKFTPVHDLQGRYVVVTRPAHQADSLCELIETHGGHAIRFPVLKIEPKIDSEFSAIVRHLKEYDLAVFISPNAVRHAWPEIKAHGGKPAHLKVAAVGKATASALAQRGCTVDIFPQQQFNSEALLALPLLQNVRGNKVVIFRGEGGRELLAQTLKERGASVDYAQCYRRTRPNIDPQPLLEGWAKHKLDILTVTSGEGLENLVNMVGTAGVEKLKNTPLVVVSERMAESAKQLGFHSSILIAVKASDDEILNAVASWVRQQKGVQ